MSNLQLDLTFIDGWENVTQQEIKSLETLKKGVDLIFKNIPARNIVSIYLKGSFYQREMNEKSDVDVEVVVDEDKYLDNLYDLQKKFGNSKDLNFGIGANSISELKTGKLSDYGNTKRANTGTFARMIRSYGLIYGKALNPNDLYLETSEKYLENYVNSFLKNFLPNYEKNIFSFGEILKQALWLFELECEVRDPKFVFSTWKELSTHFKEDHLIHEILTLRMMSNIDDERKDDFIKKLKSYLQNIIQIG